MNYEEKYNQSIEAIKRIYEQADSFGKELMEKEFPELLESEDERIRKELISFITNRDNWFPKEETKASWIAWLEKQGEQKSIEQDTEVRDLWVYIREWNDKFGRLPKDEDELASCIDYVMKRQKPADKVEPKFKVGDFIVNDYCSGKVIKITDDAYLLDTGQGIPFSCEHNSHIWTIQDAKDGNVLFSAGFRNDCIFIFDRLDNWKFDEPNGDRAVATGYCCLFVSADKMEFGMQGPDCIEVNTIKPATKIQQDLLFQKMKEAGYEWDSEKKRLKKIEQKPAWSEEDEKQIRQIERIVKDSGASTNLQNKISNWLKSIKPNHWKPSEKQLEALWNAIPHIPNSEKDIDVITELSTLYECLENL